MDAHTLRERERERERERGRGRGRGSSWSLGLVTLGALGALWALGAGCAVNDCSACDPKTEVCVLSDDCGFLQNGNLNPFSAGPSVSCGALPEACLEDRTCACLNCLDGQEHDDCRSVPGCAVDDDGHLRGGFGCE